MELDPDDAMHLSYSGGELSGLTFLKPHVRPRDVIIDVGAHIGCYSLELARLTGPEGVVLAVEADPGNFALLERNAAANGLTNITALNLAATEHPGTVPLYRSSCSALHRLHPSKHCPSVTAVTASPLDNLPQLEGKTVSLLKIDVEGAELGVLRGARNILRRNTQCAVFLEFVPAWIAEAGVDPDDLLAELFSHGGTVFAVHAGRQAPEPVDLKELLRRHPVESESGVDLWMPPRVAG